jgi:hypothetical protein
LGCRANQIKLGEYLSFKDVEVIELRVIEKNSEVEGILEDAIIKTGVPCQICSDSGPDIMPSIKKVKLKHTKIKHVPDIMHKVGNMLKKKLENEKSWEMFTKSVNNSKNRLKQSALSHMCPPSFRGKSRFFNCQIVVDWAIRTIETIQKIKNEDNNFKEINEKLGWLLLQKDNIKVFLELFELAGLSREIVRKLHIEKETWKSAEIILKERVQSDTGAIFVKEVIGFIKEQCEKTEEGQIFLGSSEIIESAFSKLKLLDRECGNSGFTMSVLGLASCFGANDFQEVKKAFEEVNYKDVIEWGNKHIGETINKKRKKSLGCRKRKKMDTNISRFSSEKSMVA